MIGPSDLFHKRKKITSLTHRKHTASALPRPTD